MELKEFKKQIELTETTTLSPIILAPSINELGEIVVTAERNIIEHKEGKLIFNVQQTPMKSGFDGIEVLQRSPNIWVDENSGILMRNQAATIKVNGKILNISGDALTNFIRNIPSEQIQAIEIQTHLSANTDAESSGGVVNIILKKKTVGFDASIRSDYTFKSKGDFRSYSGLNFNYGAKKYDRVKETINKAIIYGCILASVIYVVIILFSTEIISVFTTDETLLKETPRAMLLVFLVSPIITIQLVGSAYFQAAGKAKPALFLTLLKQGFFLIPLAYILPIYMGVDGVWYSFAIGDVLATIITFIVLKRD